MDHMGKTSTKWLDDIMKQLEAKQKDKPQQATSRFDCEICKDTEFVEVEGKYNTVKHCECVELKAAKKMLETSGIKAEDKDKTFSNFNKSEFQNINDAKENAMIYFKNFLTIENSRNNSISFVGIIDGGKKKGVGTGKTHLAIALTLNLINKKIPVKYFHFVLPIQLLFY